LKILIVQPRRIGDVIVTTPVIDALRAAFPDAQIDFLVEAAAAPVLEHNPALNDILIFDKRRFLRHVREIRARRYDWVLDFMNNPRTAQITFMSGADVRAGFRVPFWEWVYTHRVLRPQTPTYAVQSKFSLLRELGLEPPALALPRVHLRPADFEGARHWWEGTGIQEYEERVGIVATHRHDIRRWPREKFRAVMDILAQNPKRAFILFCGPGEEEYVKPLADAYPGRAFQIGRFTLRQTASVLARCHAVVTNDAGPMHLAVAVGTPTVTVYGPTWPGSWNPRVPPHRYVQAEGLRCIGCNLDQCPFNHECMDWVSPARVAREAETVLSLRAGATA
jgi:lipopolysaccharide heptosyltransferase II